MTTSRLTDSLFQLIRSLEKGEKRHFKLYIKRSSSNEELKVIQLFDALDKMEEYDEVRLLKRLPSVQKSQLSNLKSHLYKQLLASLRLLKSSESIDLQLNEQFDYAHILYKKGLFAQSLKILEKAKETARQNQKFTFLMQLVALEKRIESLHTTQSLHDRAETLSIEALEVSQHIDTVTRLSNLALQLYGWFIKNGHARNREEGDAIKQFLRKHLPEGIWNETGFYQLLYLYQSLTWYAYIRQDFLLYYRYAQKWVDLFHAHPSLKRVETAHYIKGLHNLLNAHFDLRNHREFEKTITQFEEFSQTDRVQQNENFKVQSFLYLTQAKINRHFLMGTFKEGLGMIDTTEQRLREFEFFIDPHRIMVLNYKMGSLYFGSGQFEKSIDYMQRIINSPLGLRYDLQSYARLQHLLAHYELGNHELLQYLTRSVYRFMAKMKNLTQLEKEMLNFLRRSFHIAPYALRDELKTFLERIKTYEKSRYETRVFVYLDIVSWVESKVHNRPVDRVIQEKYRSDKRRLSA